MPERPSNLEHAFGFEDEAFRRYMLLASSAQVFPSTFMRLSAQMEPATHPIVRYAAGCAAAEAAMFRSKPAHMGSRPPFLFAERQEALAIAQAHWQGVEHIFTQHQEAATDPDRAADFWQFGMKSQQALAYLPSMELVANWQSGQELDPEYQEANLQRTTERLTNIGGVVLELAVEELDFRRRRNGLAYEIAAGLILQKPRPLRHIIVPASVRQDNHRSSYKRTDLVAVSAKAGHPKAMVQVTGHVEDKRNNPGFRVIISVRPDLVLGPSYAPIKTLEALVDRENGTLQDSIISARLDEMSEALVGRLEATVA